MARPYIPQSDSESVNLSFQVSAKSRAKQLQSTAEEMTDLFKDITDCVKEHINDTEELDSIESEIRDLLGNFAKHLGELKYYRSQCELNGVSWSD